MVESGSGGSGGSGGGGGHESSAAEKAREEFFSEAQELVDGISRDLLALDETLKLGRTDPELVNDVFRGVHTLKGLSGLFGATLMAGLSHALEDVLDDLRLGRTELSPPLLDLLFRAIELYTRILAADRGDGAPPEADVKALLAALGASGDVGQATAASPVAQYELDPGLLGVLTEYEEHRLRANIQAGLGLYRIKVVFALLTIDTALDELKAKARPHGEIITYLPTGSGGEADSIELEILMASGASLATLDGALSAPNVTVEEIKRRQAQTAAPPGDVAARQPVISIPPMSDPSPVSLRAVLPGEEGGRDISLRSVSQTVRVDIRKLDHLMNIVGELAIVRTGIGRLVERVRQGSGATRELAGELHRLHRAFERNLTQIQNGILEVRMVPLGQAFDKLARVVRQISREHDKQVNLVVTGAETEIDKLIVEELSDPLMHMIRNAIDHGIESREERMRVGKPPVGTVALNAFQKGNHVVLEVEDDGAGMDPHILLSSAVRRGLVSDAEARELSPREILALVFLPGFTTKREATDMSGRGVGMDVVKKNISKLGGIVDISSELGIGTKMTITLPITLAIIGVLMVDIAGRSYAVPLANVEEAIVLDDKEVRVIDGREVLNQRGRTLPMCRLAKLFGFAPRERAPSPTVREGRRAKQFVIVAQVGNRKLGLVVDALLSQQDIVIKALGATLGQVRGIAGATELGDQRVALVLDVAALIEEVLTGDATRFLTEGSADGGALA
ncbi:MAG: chemotaxis protein CheA [Polyangiaceae bacterium]